jgi:hypothetical protein
MLESVISVILLVVVALSLYRPTYARTAPVPAAAARKAAAPQPAVAPAQSKAANCPSPGYEAAASGQGCGELINNAAVGC